MLRTKKNNKSVCFLVPYPLGQAPSQRFRFEQYFSILSNAGISYKVYPFLSQSTWQILYKQGFIFQKTMGVVSGFLRRWLVLFSLQKYDYVFIHREASPIGPPVFEWIIVRLLRKKIIYDFDDAIWLPNTTASNKLAARIKWHQKVRHITKWAYKVSCGNQYLVDYAKKYNDRVVVNPTTIDTVQLHNPNLLTQQGNMDEKGNKKTTIGWTGTHSTVKYITPLLPVLEQLEEEFGTKFLVISNQAPTFDLKGLEFVPWNKESEVLDLMQIDIGIMPLTDDQWAKGKCGFKALQYMALEKPALTSPVGVNTEIIQNGVDGYLCKTPGEWYHQLKALIQNPSQASDIGKQARKKIETKYSAKSNEMNFLSLFQ